MLWKRPKSNWPIEPSKVAFGSVVQDGTRNLSRSHVKVRYRFGTKSQFVPLATFIQHCQDTIRNGRSLGIEHLLVAPIVKRRYERFFDALTDWGPATSVAARSSREPTRRPLAERRQGTGA
jgi:hypothetical protein